MANNAARGREARATSLPLLRYLRMRVYVVTYDSGKVSLKHLLLSRYPSQSVVLGLVLLWI